MGDVLGIVTVYVLPELARTAWLMSYGVPTVTLVSCMLFTHTELIVIAVVPVLLNVIVIVFAVVLNSTFVTCPCSVAMKLKVSAPIHAATAMLTATVTAMSMIEATTGLRAFLLLNIFILLFIPPSGVIVYFSRG